jgi:CRISPR type IV-associated protein Csf2
MRPGREVNYREKYPQGDTDTARLPRLAVSGDGGSGVYTAYFPAAGIRGKLRRMARNAVAEIAENPWDIDTHRTLTIGGVKGSGSEPSLDLKGMRELRKHYAIQSVFGQSSGFGVSWIGGKLMVGFAVPEKPLTPDIVTGIRSDDLVRNPDEAEFLSKEAYTQLSEIAGAERKATRLRQEKKALEKELRQVEKKGDDERVKIIQESLERIEAETEALSDLLSADVSVQMPLSGYEVIPPGTPLTHRMVLRNPDEAETGVVFAALEKFATDPQLGAHAAQGCGIVQTDWEVIVDGESLGRVIITPYRAIQYEGEKLARLAKAAKAAFRDSVTASPLVKGEA